MRRSAAFTNVRTDYYPAPLRDEIDRVNARIYENVNNGVYRAGFATTQEAYEEAFRDVFAALDELEQRLSRQRYLAGRGDHRGRLAAVHHAGALRRGLLRPLQMQPAPHRRLSQSVELSARPLPAPGVAETVNIDHIKRHYYGSHRNVNPTGIVPLGPLLDFTAPHDRGRFGD